MIQLDDLTISKKLFILIIVGIVALIVVGMFGITTTQQVNSQLEQLYNNKYAHSVLAIQAYSDMLNYAVEGYRFSAETDMEKRKDMLKNNVEPFAVRFKEKLTAYESIPMADDEKETVTKLKKLSDEYFTIVAKANSLTLEGKIEELNKIRTEQAAPKRAETMAEIQNLVNLNNQSAYQYYSEAQSASVNTIIQIIIVTIICALILLVISWFIIRNLTRRINILTNGMDEVGSGNLSYRIGLTGKDEITHIGSSFDSMTGNLEKQSFEINQNIERSKRANVAIMNMAEEIKAGNIDATITTSDYEGEFFVTVQSVNDLVHAFVLPIKEAMNIVNQFAAGNFAIRYDNRAQVRGDFEKFKQALDNSGICVSDAIKEVKIEVETLSSVMEETNASAEEVASTTNMLAKSSSSVSLLAERSGSGITQTLTAMNDLSSTVSAVATKAEQASVMAKQTVELSEKGLTLAGKAENGMEGIIHSFEATGSNISDITSQMDEIGKIVGVITGIAEQTGLLALNAAIEAARAGEAGLGFAVVADEVKALALESQKSAENIATIIGNLQKKSLEVSESMNTVSSEVKAGNEAVTETLSVFNEIVKAIDVVHNNMTEVAGATEEQAAAVEEITASVHEVGSLVQQTATEAVDSAAATEEVTASIDQITKAISEAAASVQNISTQMGTFTIS
ncbi:MAG: HAMP domain-containing protein [Methanomicrobiales archaeon]|nr:HAMP domain-containing protein [Methanomicrobiales archaeon]